MQHKEHLTRHTHIHSNTRTHTATQQQISIVVEQHVIGLALLLSRNYLYTDDYEPSKSFCCVVLQVYCCLKSFFFLVHSMYYGCSACYIPMYFSVLMCTRWRNKKPWFLYVAVWILYPICNIVPNVEVNSIRFTFSFLRTIKTELCILCSAYFKLYFSFSFSSRIHVLWNSYNFANIYDLYSIYDISLFCIPMMKNQLFRYKNVSL